MKGARLRILPSASRIGSEPPRMKSLWRLAIPSAPGLSAANGMQQLGLDIRRFDLRARADHGGIFRQNQNIGAGQRGLGGQALDAEQKRLKLAGGETPNGARASFIGVSSRK